MPSPKAVPVRLAVVAITALAVQMLRAADEPSLDLVVKRVAAYVTSYGPQLATIVAEEHYRQWVETEPGTVVVPSLGRTRREIKSDFALTRLGDGHTWVAFRDAFEVDGAPLRDREDRLVALLSSGTDQAWRQAAAIANESARFNVGSRLITRNINVPTFVIQLMQDHNRERFRFSRVKISDRGGPNKPGAVDDESASRWAIEYRERSRPTLVRQTNGGDQPLRGMMIVDPQTGEVSETNLTWERGPGGHIGVTFGRVPDIDALVPIRMVEQYRDARTTIFGEASYSRFRRFSTSARVVTPGVP
jgi:hypothetical protein